MYQAESPEDNIATDRSVKHAMWYFRPVQTAAERYYATSKLPHDDFIPALFRGRLQYWMNFYFGPALYLTHHNGFRH